MRVIAGSARGKKLKAPKGTTTRPPLDRVKEAMFGILGDAVAGARVLDLFAGSGSLGIEALSRGAAEAVFVDDDTAAITVIKENLAALGLAGRARVKKASVGAYLQRNADGDGPFDLIFLDPPFRISLIDIGKIFEVLQADGLPTGSGIVVLRVYAKREIVDFPGFALAKDRSYGDSRLLFYGRMT